MLSRWSQWEPTHTLFDELLRRMNVHQRTVAERQPWATPPAWPLLSLFDNGEQLYLVADVPGMSEKELEVSLNDDVVTIRGERDVSPPEGYTYHRRERPSVTFARSIQCPCKVDPKKVTASTRAGVLVIEMEKAEAVKPRTIKVRAHK